MCGFAGVIVWDERFRVTRDQLRAMSAKIAHRGPDGEGLLLTREHEPITPQTPQVALAFRRLAILDPDPRSMQPFSDDRYTMVFNGEIYNYRELREEITHLNPTHNWRTTGDTEVLLAAYAHWGKDCLHKLNGMFAIAIWDAKENSLFLSRDRMGQKPLYVHTHLISSENLENEQIQRPSMRVAFASETAAIHTLPETRRPVGICPIHEFLSWGYTEAQPFEFSSLRPANWLRTDSATSSRNQYFSHMTRGPKEKHWCSPEITDAARATETRRLTKQAVQRQLVSDVPLGVFLSGGMDSSVIAACARKHGPVQTFSIAFDDPRYDESKFAREVARHLGTDHHEFRVTPNVIEDLPKLAEVFGEPFADSSMIPTHCLARETRKHVKVALSGDGGDELFGGYDRYRAMLLGEYFKKIPGSTFVTAFFRPHSGGHPKARVTRLARFFESIDKPPDERYASYTSVFRDDLLSSLLVADLPTRYRVKLNNLHFIRLRDYLRRGVVPAALALDRETYLPYDLLAKVDRCSMLHGLEVRSPFMDHELVRFASTLTADQLLKGGPKRMLREAFAADLPAFVFKRKKMGFAVPIGEWFRGPLRAFLRDHLFAADSFARANFKLPVVERMIEEHESERVDHSQRLFALLMLELWWDTAQSKAR